MATRAYRIVVEGVLGPRFEAVFAGMRLETDAGETAIVTAAVDQAQLCGVLDAINALGLALVSVTPCEETNVARP